MSHWRSETECHAAFQMGDAELKWVKMNITDEDAQWIASALANPAVRDLHLDDACVLGTHS